MKGLIVKGIAGFYYVSCGEEIIECKARGIFKNRGITPAVGDEVDISLTEPGRGVIEEILPRKNIFIRPPIANIDMFIVVMAASHPKPNFPVIDRFLVMADAKDADIVICVNKIDIAKPKDIENIREIYEGIYPVALASAETGEGIEELKSKLSGQKAAFAGPSGVGKSSLLNAMLPQANAQMGELSQKTKRGRHTTRHVEIFNVGDFMIYDTPGFTSFDITEAEEDTLYLHYPEMARYKGMCYYDDCRHLKEPDCMIKKALADGRIHPMRYESYKTQIEELRSKKNKY
jgi:ribosome biogenesis GTPase / thiamine phosphate phosphatase